MEYDLIIKNGTVVTPDETVLAAVLVKDGKFAGLVGGEILPAAREVYDASGLHVLPGIIDIHVHFRDPGLTYKEDFETGSLAAAFGGVTTVGDMPNVLPPTSNMEGLQAKLAEATKKAHVDYGVYAVVFEENIRELPALAEGGVMGFKIFMGETVGKLPSPSDGGIIEAMKVIAKTGLRLGVHAEDNSIIKYYTEEFKAEGRTDPIKHWSAFPESRPNVAEAECIGRAILFARVAGCKLHIYHMSSREGVELVRSARARGQDVTAETGPHYLLLDASFMQKVGTMLKMNPPVRSKADAEALWQGLLDGSVAAIATDHSPHTREEKLKDNIWDAIPGFCGVETAVPLILTEVNKGRLTLNQYVKVASEGPAKVFNLYPQKGCLRIGSDADLTIVDMDKEAVIQAEKLHSKNKVTPFEGFQVKGMPIATIVRGNIVMRNGKIESQPAGQLVRPSR